MNAVPVRISMPCVALALSLLLSGAATAGPIPPGTKDPLVIMKAVDQRPAGDRATRRMTMTIKDASGSKRVRVVRSQSMDFTGGTRQLILFESPADVRNTGLLTVDYDDGGKVDDQWLYLPSLRKSTRISSSDKSGPFMGSDLSFADMTNQALDQYDYKMLKQSARVGGEECWVISTRPKTKKAKDETGYVKSMVWISKSRLMPLQSKHWIKKGKKIKLMKFAKISKISGIWVPHKIMARTLQRKKVLSTTILDFSGVTFNSPKVTAKNFTQRRLEQGL